MKHFALKYLKISWKFSVAVLGKTIGGLAPHHLAGNNG